MVCIVYSCNTAEYKSAMGEIQAIVSDHITHLVPGEPQLNYCDNAVMVSVIHMNSGISIVKIKCNYALILLLVVVVSPDKVGDA